MNILETWYVLIQLIKKEKKKDDWPFALFVGVNNHKQSIIFGAPLVYEDLWKFKCVCLTLFVKEISDKKSQDILIDQDLTMAKALVSQ